MKKKNEKKMKKKNEKQHFCTFYIPPRALNCHFLRKKTFFAFYGLICFNFY